MSSRDYNHSAFTQYSASDRVDEQLPFSASTSSGTTKHHSPRDASGSQTHFFSQPPTDDEDEETPVPSRSESPVLPQFVPSATSSAYTSDSESAPTSLFLRNRRSGSGSDDDSFSSWLEHRTSRRRRRRKSGPRGVRTCRRICGSVFTFVVSHPIIIVRFIPLLRNTLTDKRRSYYLSCSLQYSLSSSPCSSCTFSNLIRNRSHGAFTARFLAHP